jgi:hypothetical protein
MFIRAATPVFRSKTGRDYIEVFLPACTNTVMSDGPTPHTRIGDSAHAGRSAIWQLFQENAVSFVVEVLGYSNDIECAIYAIVVTIL